MVVVPAYPFLTKYLAKNKLIILGSLGVIADEVILLTNPHSFHLLIISCVMRAVGLPRRCIGGSLFYLVAACHERFFQCVLGEGF